MGIFVHNTILKNMGRFNTVAQQKTMLYIIGRLHTGVPIGTPVEVDIVEVGDSMGFNTSGGSSRNRVIAGLELLPSIRLIDEDGTKFTLIESVEHIKGTRNVTFVFTSYAHKFFSPLPFFDLQ